MFSYSDTSVQSGQRPTVGGNDLSQLQVLGHYCLCGSVNWGHAVTDGSKPAVSAASVGEPENYLSQAAVGVVVGWATVRAVAAPRLLLFV